MEFLKAGEAAKYLGMSIQTLRNLQDKGMLIPEQKFPSGHRKYTKKQLDEFLQKMSDGDEAGLEYGDFMTSREVCKYCNFSIAVLNSLEKDGYLKPRRRLPISNKRLYIQADIDKFLESLSVHEA